MINVLLSLENSLDLPQEKSTKDPACCIQCVYGMHFFLLDFFSFCSPVCLCLTFDTLRKLVIAVYSPKQQMW